MAAATEDLAVTRFREYLRINTMQPKPDYASCSKFLVAYGKELGLATHIVEPVAGKPFVVLTQLGTDQSASSLMLYSHTDVVPVFPEHWKYDPFSAHKDEKGDIYARGAQDMKCVGVQYLEAIRRLKGQKCVRTIHLLFAPDEEISSVEGMQELVKTDYFKSLNVGFMLDEGLASPENHYTVYNGERCPWWLKVTCKGQPGHGSLFVQNTAAAKLQKVINSFLGYRDEQEALYKRGGLTMGHVTTVNMTMLEGGVQTNVVPAQLSAVFDIRVTPLADFEELQSRMESWCKAAGDGVEMEWIQQLKVKSMTDASDKNPFWVAIETVFKQMKLEHKLDIFVGATDSRFVRQLGIQCINFSPMNNTPVLLHDHNEFLNEQVFLRGVDIYEKLIPQLANVQ